LLISASWASTGGGGLGDGLGEGSSDGLGLGDGLGEGSGDGLGLLASTYSATHVTASPAARGWLLGVVVSGAPLVVL
jgi:hypothetical protein